jgi:hypothetical protein
MCFWRACVKGVIAPDFPPNCTKPLAIPNDSALGLYEEVLLVRNDLL